VQAHGGRRRCINLRRPPDRAEAGPGCDRLSTALRCAPVVSDSRDFLSDNYDFVNQHCDFVNADYHLAHDNLAHDNLAHDNLVHDNLARDNDYVTRPLGPGAARFSHWCRQFPEGDRLDGHRGRD
jgi:hypothetical protein